MGKDITGEQAIELGTIGGVMTLHMAEEARDFCTRHGLNEGPDQVHHFNAAVMTILETIVFMGLTGTYDHDHQMQQKVLTEILRGTRRQLKAWHEHQRSTRQ